MSGEIQVRNPCLMSGYLHLLAETREAFTADGFLRTGDIAVGPIRVPRDRELSCHRPGMLIGVVMAGLDRAAVAVARACAVERADVRASCVARPAGAHPALVTRPLQPRVAAVIGDRPGGVARRITRARMTVRRPELVGPARRRSNAWHIGHHWRRAGRPPTSPLSPSFTAEPPAPPSPVRRSQGKAAGLGNEHRPRSR